MKPKQKKFNQKEINQRRETYLKFTVVVAAVFLSASACQHERTTENGNWEKVHGTEAHPTPGTVFSKLPTPLPGLTQLTTIGENSQARFSADGSKIIFISRSRPPHKQAQVYELILSPAEANGTSAAERRLTFHDGDDLSPVYTADGNHIYYASTTDELKEENVATEKLMREYYPQGLKDGSPTEAAGASANVLAEIYFQTLNGRDIERLTDSSGFDGEIDVQKDDKRIVFTSARDGLPGLYVADAKIRGARRVTPIKESDRGGRFSPDGKKLLWYRAGASAPTSESYAKIFLAEGDFKKPRELLRGEALPPSLIPVASPSPVSSPSASAAVVPFSATSTPEQLVDPSWTPDGLSVVYASNRNGRFFNLYSVDLASGCVKRLSALEMDETQPAVSPDGKRILFTGHRTGAQQLYMIDFHPLGECLNHADPQTPATGSPTSAPVTPPASPTSSPTLNPTTGSASS